MMKKIFSVLLFFYFFFIFPSFLFADDFQTEYHIEYFLEKQNSSQTKAKISIPITNLRSGTRLESFSLGFPADFPISGISVSADEGSASYETLQKGDQIILVVYLQNDKTNRGDANTARIELFQENIARTNGSVTELLVPVMEDALFDSIKITVHTADANTVSWENPKTKLMYAVFGNSRYYALDLSYHIANTNLAPVYTEIALPPVTSHQVMYIESIQPKPDSGYVDADGNYMVKYNLAPKEKKTVVFKGFAEIKARQNVFSLSDDAKKIYRSVVNSSFTTSREFSREFIRLAREKGVRAREIQGFADFFHPKLRPISLMSDNIHSWVEIYDTAIDTWMPLDPMWEHATGIDYTSQFDMNHVAFAIHEKNDEYPLPAGMYKWENSKDVSVQAIVKLPDNKILLSDKIKEFSRKKSLWERIADFLKRLHIFN